MTAVQNFIISIVMCWGVGLILLFEQNYIATNRKNPFQKINVSPMMNKTGFLKKVLSGLSWYIFVATSFKIISIGFKTRDCVRTLSLTCVDW